MLAMPLNQVTQRNPLLMVSNGVDDMFPVRTGLMLQIIKVNTVIN